MTETLTGYKVVALKELIEAVGEDAVKGILSDFSCPLNADVEMFLREKAILFSNQAYGATHLVFTGYRRQVVLVGYFALANKSVTIKGRYLTSRWRHRLNRFANYDQDLGQYHIALPLIGQLSKNFTNDYQNLITGDELLKMACDKIRDIQLALSGRMAYLECEDIPALIEFYTRNGFYRFANRMLDRDETSEAKTPYLVQMLRYFD